MSLRNRITFYVSRGRDRFRLAFRGSLDGRGFFDTGGRLNFEQGKAVKMADKGKCDFECKYLDEVGECESCGQSEECEE